MRTLYNIPLLKQIELHPEKYIVQRDYVLLDSFMIGYELLLKVKNDEYFSTKYAGIPAMQEHILHKYKADTGTRNFSSIIAYISENEQDLFYNYLNHIYEYDKIYPVHEPIQFVVVPEKENNLKQWIEGMRKRYRMYFGYNDLAAFRAFLDGYFCCKKEHGVSLNIFEQGIIEFTQHITCENLQIENNFTTWDRKYRYNKDWKPWGRIDDKTAEKMLEDFWEDWDDFFENCKT